MEKKLFWVNTSDFPEQISLSLDIFSFMIYSTFLAVTAELCHYMIDGQEFTHSLARD